MSKFEDYLEMINEKKANNQNDSVEVLDESLLSDQEIRVLDSIRTKITKIISNEYTDLKDCKGTEGLLKHLKGAVSEINGIGFARSKK